MGKRAQTQPVHSNRHERLENRARRRTVILAIFIIAVMVLSAFGVMLYGYNTPENSYALGNYSFQSISDTQSTYWKIVASPDKKYLGLRFETLPAEGYESEFFPSLREVLNPLNAASYVYISTAQPQSSDDAERQILQAHELARFELSELFTLNDVIPISATSSKATLVDQPIITCANATSQAPVIMIVDTSLQNVSSKEGIFAQSPYCIEIIASSPLGALQLSDTLRFAYIQ